MAKETSTLVASEAQWAPLAWVASLGAVGAGAALLLAGTPHGQSGTGWPLWSLGCLSWLVLTGSNVLYVLQHKRPTVGMMPVATFSLLPTSLVALHARVLIAPCAALALMSGAVGVYMGRWFQRLAGTYAHRARLTDDCVAIVLGGTVRDGRPCRTLRRRLDVAYNLCAGKPHRLLILTGGLTDGAATTEAEAMAAYLVSRGLSGSRIILETAARNTEENISLAGALAKAHGLHTRQLCVVTSDYHLYRAVREGRRAGMELVPIPSPTPPSSFLQQWCREVLTIVSKR